jgi:hypothetical protein
MPSRSESYTWTKMPIVCVCSKVRHEDLGFKEEIPFNEMHGFTKILDLHTFEAPITTANYDLTVDQIGLKDLTIDGVLNLYAVTRDTSATSSARVTGKDAIFLEAEHWVSVLCSCSNCQLTNRCPAPSDAPIGTWNGSTTLLPPSFH